jgi:hypothetical protein
MSTDQEHLDLAELRQRWARIFDALKAKPKPRSLDLRASKPATATPDKVTKHNGGRNG